MSLEQRSQPHRPGIYNVTCSSDFFRRVCTYWAEVSIHAVGPLESLHPLPLCLHLRSHTAWRLTCSSPSISPKHIFHGNPDVTQAILTVLVLWLLVIGNWLSQVCRMLRATWCRLLLLRE